MSLFCLIRYDQHETTLACRSLIGRCAAWGDVRDMSATRRQVATMRPIVGWLCGACLLVGCSRSEVHLLPAGVKGDVFILPGHAEGVPARREGFAIVFEVPRGRILVTQDEPSGGWHWTRFYYVDTDGRRQRLDYEPSTVPRTPENLADRRPFVWFVRGGGGVFGSPCPFRFVQYYVGTRADLLSRTVDEANAEELRLGQFVKEHRICP